MSTVLVVDDKEMMRDSVGQTLERAGFAVEMAEGGDQALERIAVRRPDAVVTDLRMPGMDGLTLLERIRSIDDELPVVLMTAFGAIDTAIRAMKLGAFDYITKPFEGDELIIGIKRAVRHGKTLRENAVLRAGVAPPGRTGLERLVGDSPALRRVKEQVRAVSASGGNVLICGESGTGKEVVARAIHDLSPRRDRTLLAVNCAALSEGLLESELFGHERGAFTGAERMRKGRFELADSGTLLLDEISEVSPKIQAKLLRVLQERSFERVGSSTSIGVDVRVVATSNRDLPRAVEAGDFRQDLFFRLNVLPIHMPPLRDRPEDIPELAAHFLEEVCRREGRAIQRFDDGALHLMLGYGWPGNVRELQNICERAAVLNAARHRSAEERLIGSGLIESWLSAPASPSGSGRSIVESKPPAWSNGHVHVNGHASLREELALEQDGRLKTLDEIERETIVRTLRKFSGHRQRTAQALGIGVRTLGLKLKKWKEEQLVEQTL
ncbi:MAG: sigma-54-dependent Fis family transcriptional regulator [Phycisphaeraceae bacterium]|nr:sigma-54-dependent Fis family transcriptional regulator [Phycisphaeraceae bacterium]